MAEVPCDDCGFDTHKCEYYMVSSEVWEKAGMSYFGFLCIGCLENRISRKLTSSDFTKCPLNDSPDFTRSVRLQNRKSKNA